MGGREWEGGGHGSCCNCPCRKGRWDAEAPFHVSTGLGTILLGVSGNWEDREVTSLPEELPRDPDSEKDTCKDGDKVSEVRGQIQTDGQAGRQTGVHTPVAGRRAGPGRSAGQTRSGLSTEAGRSEPPPGCPARRSRVGSGCQQPEGFLSGPAGSVTESQTLFKLLHMQGCLLGFFGFVFSSVCVCVCAAALNKNIVITCVSKTFFSFSYNLIYCLLKTVRVFFSPKIILSGITHNHLEQVCLEAFKNVFTHIFKIQDKDIN